MNITRHNYEEYFMLYIDNELNAAGRAAVEGFVQENPDLAAELEALRDTQFLPDESVVFTAKHDLLRSGNPVTAANHEDYFISYGDDELSLQEKEQVEQFVYDNPAFQQEFELLQLARLSPDPNLRFPDKQSLYRSEKDERVVIIRWWRYAAAAAVILLVGSMAWFYASNNKPADGLATKPGNTPLVPPAKKSQEQQAPQQQLALAAETVTPEQHTTESHSRNKELISFTAANNTKAQKNIPQGSNKTELSPVLPSKDVIIAGTDHNPEVKGNELKTLAIAPEKRPEIIDQAVGPEPINNNAVFASNTDEQIEVLNTSVSKKTKMRGFFRKVNKLVEKTTGIGNGDNENAHGIRIANFEIALK